MEAVPPSVPFVVLARALVSRLGAVTSAQLGLLREIELAVAARRCDVEACCAPARRGSPADALNSGGGDDADGDAAVGVGSDGDAAATASAGAHVESTTMPRSWSLAGLLQAAAAEVDGVAGGADGVSGMPLGGALGGGGETMPTILSMLPAASVTTIAGGFYGATDGDERTARFSFPAAITKVSNHSFMGNHAMSLPSFGWRTEDIRLFLSFACALFAAR